MSAQYRWNLAYFGHLVIKNSIKVALSVKRDTSQFADAQKSMVRQDIWALPTKMGAFGICVRDLASTTQLLVHPSEITPAELMDQFRKLGKFYELLDCRTSVALLVIFKIHVTAHFARLRKCTLKNDSELPTPLDVITTELRLTVNQVVESTRQRVSRYMIPDHERGRTGSLYRGDHVTCLVNTMPLEST